MYLRGPQSLSGKWRIRSHRQFLEPELKRAVVHDHVDKVDHVRLGYEGCHPISAESLRIHHPVGPYAEKLRFR